MTVRFGRPEKENSEDTCCLGMPDSGATAGHGADWYTGSGMGRSP